jgi:hypothetical protein
VTTGGELEEVESLDGASLNAGDVAEALDKLLSVDLGVVDDQRATALAVTATTQLTLTSTELLGALDLLDVGASTNGLQETESSGGLGVGGTVESGGVDNQRNLGNGVDLVATGEEKRGDGRSSQSGSGSETPRVLLVYPTTTVTGLLMATTYFCPWLILTCHLRQVLVGANMRPPRHMLPKAA